MTGRRIPLLHNGTLWRGRVLGRYAGLLQAAVERRELTDTEATDLLMRAVVFR